jgi:hypothetical protein
LILKGISSLKDAINYLAVRLFVSVRKLKGMSIYDFTCKRALRYLGDTISQAPFCHTAIEYILFLTEN